MAAKKPAGPPPATTICRELMEIKTMIKIKIRRGQVKKGLD
jgi:hypothetical protein